jgi:hypothetical protein
MNSPSLFTEGVSPKICLIFLKIFFRLSSPENFFVKIEKFFQKMNSPPLFTGGMSPKICAIFFFKKPKKIFSDFFSKIQKNFFLSN